jgi:hypothetical protein
VGAGVAEALQVSHLLAFVEGLAVVHAGTGKPYRGALFKGELWGRE